jgi:hypothetical protein
MVVVAWPEMARTTKCPHQPVRRHEAVPGYVVSRDRADRSRYLRDGLGRSRARTRGLVGSGHEGAQLRHCALRHVEQRLRLDRKTHDGNRRGQLPHRGTAMDRHAAVRPQGDVSIADSVRLGQWADADGRPEGLRGCGRASEAICADAARRVGQAVHAAGRGAAGPGRRWIDAGGPADPQNGRRHLLQTAHEVDEGQSTGRRRRADARQAPEDRNRARRVLRLPTSSIRRSPRACGTPCGDTSCCKRASRS